ncbi:hypothetical protein HRI_000162100 [Hibiscus trionum]|uniref:Uncharacterized protein n=1 Tax=Hibiscus trionum TaxID=183268 RepID=A0A9W7GUY9_HIBTR|nr:hypothetical protein HRI_000162100 [Hibiscus trionum]
MSVTPRWSRKKPHFPLLALLFLVFITSSILYNEFRIQQIHRSPDHGSASSTQRTSFTFVKPNLPNGASGVVIHLRSSLFFFEFQPKRFLFSFLVCLNNLGFGYLYLCGGLEVKRFGIKDAKNCRSEIEFLGKRKHG